MTKNEYIKSLRAKIATAESPKEVEEASEKLEYAYSKFSGREDQFRDRLIASLIKEKFNADAQLAILFNEHLEPEEYSAYQAYRVECKAKADALITKLRAEVEGLI